GQSSSSASLQFSSFSGPPGWSRHESPFTPPPAPHVWKSVEKTIPLTLRLLDASATLISWLANVLRLETCFSNSTQTPNASNAPKPRRSWRPPLNNFDLLKTN